MWSPTGERHRTLWIPTVTDRTQRDVEEALSKLAEWRKWISVGLVPETYELKGCLNVSDLNRIENNLEYLIELIKELDPEETEINYVKTNWSVTDMPNISDIERILGVLRDIRVKYDIPLSQTPVPNTMLHFDDVNRVEENLNLLLYKLYEIARSISEAFPLWFELEIYTWGDIENYTWETLVNIREGE